MKAKKKATPKRIEAAFSILYIISIRYLDQP